METTMIISLTGFIITLFLSVNAYFLKGILSELSELKVTAATLLSDNMHTEKEIERIDEEITRMREKIHDLSNVVAKLKMTNS
jgi:peptidoglycan hydrolase CwlO-like protein